MSRDKPPTSPTSGSAPGQPCNGAAQSCPCKPITNITVKSVEFFTDHRLLKDNAANWKDTGNLYPRPHWTPAIHRPVSHSMDKQVELRLVIEVQPPEACPEEGTLEGEGPVNLAFQPVDVAFRPGLNTVSVTSSTKIPKVVQKLNFAVNWLAKAKSAEFNSSTASYCLVTIDTPINEGIQEDGVTLKRMDKAIDLVQPTGSIDPHTIVAALMKKFPFYTLERNPAVPLSYNHPRYYNSEGGAWPMADNIGAYGECQAIVRFVRGVIKQLGCPGTTETVVIWTDPDNNAGATVIESAYGGATLHNKSKTVGGKTWYPALAARDPQTVGTVFPPGSMMNMYEACLKFTHNGVMKYYGGGAGVYDTKEEVIKAFYALVWYSKEIQASGNVYNRIEDIVHRYR